MADDIAPAIVQAAALMNGMTVASIRAKGVGFTVENGFLEQSDAYRVVGVERNKARPFYYIEDAINYLLGEGYRLLSPSDLESWTRTLNSGKELSEMNVAQFDGNICVAVFGREAVAQIAANLESEGRGTTSNCPTAQLTASILAASARYNLPEIPSRQIPPPVPRHHMVVSLSRLAAENLDQSSYWAVRGLGKQEEFNSWKAGLRFVCLEDAFNFCVESGCVPMEKTQEERWKRLIGTGRELVGADTDDSNWPYFLSGEVLHVFMMHV
jgi:hypothetical protein